MIASRVNQRSSFDDDDEDEVMNELMIDDDVERSE